MEAAKIEVRTEAQTEAGWRFTVEVDGMEYAVTLDKEHWERLTDGQQSPAELVKRSFEFLLSREPKESILAKFNLQEISRYFPKYETEIKKGIKTTEK